MFARLFGLVFSFFVVAGLMPVHAQTSQAPTPVVSAEERAKIESVVREFLIRNPEVLQEALVELEKRQAQAEEQARVSAFSDNREALYRAPGQIVLGNPRGDVTLVEFFDYNCGFCKRALQETVDLLKADTRIRLVLKDFPVLGPGSVEAAQVAVAIKKQLDPVRYLDFHQRLLGGRGQANRARALEVAREVGADIAKLERDMNAADVRETLAENARLAELLRINGTPTYVIGDEVVVGAVGSARLREQIAKARTGCGRTAGVC
ncbi:MAG: DsbA family protein [Alphaproteobacteria bacterium]|jgi:protein-disulfide isomerase